MDFILFFFKGSIKNKNKLNSGLDYDLQLWLGFILFYFSSKDINKIKIN
jgi:hypothetical protein